MTVKYERQFKVGDTVWCKTNDGEIHSGSLLGIFYDTEEISNYLYVVCINDEDDRYITCKTINSYVAYFETIYCAEEIAQI